MAISTGALLACVQKAGYPEVTEAKLTRWKYLRFIESRRPGRGRGRGRGRAQWDEAMCGTVCAIARFLRTRRDLGDGVLSAWLAGNPVPLATVRKLLVRSGERWLEPLPFDTAMPADLQEGEQLARVSGDASAELDDSMLLHAEELAEKAAVLKGIPRRYRLALTQYVIRIALGLAQEHHLRDALEMLAKVAPELHESFSRELLRLGDVVALMAPFSVHAIRKTIGKASDEDLLAARQAYARARPYLFMTIFLTMILLSARSQGGRDLNLVLGPLLVTLNPAYSFTAFLSDKTRKERPNGRRLEVHEGRPET